LQRVVNDVDFVAGWGGPHVEKSRGGEVWGCLWRRYCGLDL